MVSILIMALGVAVLKAIAQNPTISSTWRLIAQDAESQLFKDMESEALYLLKDGVLYLVG